MKNKKTHHEEALESSSDGAGVSAEEQAGQLMQTLEEKTKEAAELQEKYLRTYADFENYRKRTQRDAADFKKYANEQFAHDILSVVDHLELAIKHASETVVNDQKAEALLEGVKLIHKQLNDILEKYGIQSFSAEGEPFDPTQHDAVAQEITDAVPENTVVHVLQTGYRYHDKILRHAKVSVAKRPEAPQNGDQNSEADQNE